MVEVETSPPPLPALPNEKVPDRAPDVPVSEESPEGVPLPDEQVPDRVPDVPVPESVSEESPEGVSLPDEKIPERAPDVDAAAAEEDNTDAAAPLPDEQVPDRPPDETANNPEPEADDGWDAIWEPSVEQYYFYNRFTQETTWDNPRVPPSADAVAAAAAEKPLTLAEKLAQDPEFQKLSKSERIKRYEQEQAKLEQEAAAKAQQQRDEVPVEVDAKKHAQMLASTFGDATGRVRQDKHRVTKEDMKQYKKQKKERKEKKLKEWLYDDMWCIGLIITVELPALPNPASFCETVQASQ